MKKDENGFSMVGALIAAAFVAGIALVIAQLGDSSKKIQSSTKASLELSATISNIEKLLLNSQHCSATFSGLSFSPGVAVPISEIVRNNSGTNETVYELSTPGAKVLIPNTSIEITAMNATRDTANPNLLNFQVEFSKANAAAGMRQTNKQFALEARFSALSLQRCFSQLDGAVLSACEALGGTIQDTDCVDTRLQCEMRRQFMKWKGVPGTQTICGKNYELKRIVVNETATTPRTHTLPSTFVEGTFKANILGGGGGGGCGCADHGTGGTAGSETFLVKSQTDPLVPGNIIRYQKGAGGAGGRGSGCRFSRHNGRAGNTSFLQLPTITITAGAGSGGRARSNNHGHGYDSRFMNVVYPGAPYSSNRSGRSGVTGSGGAGGEKNAADCRSGGRGGDGVVLFEYMTFTEI